jgi:flagellar basal-body rod protein FlgF
LHGNGGIFHVKGIWVPVSGQVAQERKIDVLANNIANTNTVGFKRDDSTFKEYLTEYENPSFDIDIPRKDFTTADMYRTREVQQGKVQNGGTYSNFAQGDLLPTQGPLDFAIQGEGFFAVDTPQGIRYTRKGNFVLNNEGILVTDKGYQVLAELPLEGQAAQKSFVAIKRNIPFQVDSQGNVFQSGKNISKIAIAEFGDKQALAKESSGLFVNKEGQTPVIAKASQCLQGHLEQSNVNPVQEMTELIKAHRQFESMQRAIRAYDEIGSKSTNEIIKF